MDLSKYSRSAICKAFKSATSLMLAELETRHNIIVSKSGIDPDAYNNARHGYAAPTIKDLEQIENAFPGFIGVFREYLDGKRGWGITPVEIAREEAVSFASDTEKEAAYWREKYLSEVESHKSTLYKALEKNLLK